MLGMTGKVFCNWRFLQSLEDPDQGELENHT